MPTSFQKKLTTTALQEFEKFHLLREAQEPLRTRIEKYWRELKFKFENVSVPWSAVFVSWCVQTAGATSQQFRFSPQHSVFVHFAIKNAKSETGLFRGRRVGEYSPKIGDILQNNRGKQITFDEAAKNADYPSHSAIVTEVGADNVGLYLRTVGGNEGDSVGMKEVRLDSKGRVKNPDGLYIAVIETLL